MSHPIFARVYARMSVVNERGVVGEHRARLLSGLSGQVIEVGAGNGLNFAHYPPEVTWVLAVEPDPHLRRIALRAAEDAAVAVEVVDGVADRLPADDESFDAAVSSLVLCSVPDQAAALAEMHRVVRPGGQLRFFEHVLADTPALRRMQRLFDATIWPMVSGGCHAARDTAAAIEKAGFAIDQLDRFNLPEARIRFPTAPHVLGTASRQKI